ncbi:hypothetical protein [Paenibacillus sacheonensis]|uniref:Uncharacterized protein n=1 Tax=Paenibacillus sacheonensis TaxID=742054 RepID=A0A7X4YPL2_9BACL|nr:hypothetical protein [Paenibacillus sacheonensis]MBM7564723.1 hypothetical protein [Paenibacillus sacheonensis]NBC69279.1 hypothetical protein [Paenibacillus sacheonensis]
MKRLITGGLMMFGGIALYISSTNAAVHYLPLVTEWRSSVFQEALRKTGGAGAHTAGIWLIAVGLLILLYVSFFEGVIRRYAGASMRKMHEANEDWEKRDTNSNVGP